MLKRSEMNVEPRPERLARRHLVDQLGRRLRRAGEHVEAELVQLVVVQLVHAGIITQTVRS